VRVTADIFTVAGNVVNEDRAGIAGALAWVIDGATDVVEAPLTTGPTDASWIAETLDSMLRGYASAPVPELSGLPAVLAERLDSEFQSHSLAGLARDRLFGGRPSPSRSPSIASKRSP
jgi:hypothetical protein